MAWTVMGWMDMGEDPEPWEPDPCEEVNPDTGYVCGRGFHEDGLHWHGTDDGPRPDRDRVEWVGPSLADLEAALREHDLASGATCCRSTTSADI